MKKLMILLVLLLHPGVIYALDNGYFTVDSDPGSCYFFRWSAVEDPVPLYTAHGTSTYNYWPRDVTGRLPGVSDVLNTEGNGYNRVYYEIYVWEVNLTYPNGRWRKMVERKGDVRKGSAPLPTVGPAPEGAPSGDCGGSACQSLSGAEGAKILFGLEFHADYYGVVGLCQDGCLMQPGGGVILDQYGGEGVGYSIGPWLYTGGPCVEGISPPVPEQPSEDKKCDWVRSACEANCKGRSYDYDCDGSCECTGPPAFTEGPPLNPTDPETDPGQPDLPPDAVPETDPGGNEQLGVVIDNQGKQLEQGGAQLGQLGAVNDKLAAIIGNQGLQLGQGDKGLDYARRQLGALEDIRNKLSAERGATQGDFGDYPELDGSIPDDKDWNEYDDAERFGLDAAGRRIEKVEETENPLDFKVTTSSASPVLSGVLFGRTVVIRFDEDWMTTGYAIMRAMFISLGYLQVFLMIHSTVARG